MAETLGNNNEQNNENVNKPEEAKQWFDMAIILEQKKKK